MALTSSNSTSAPVGSPFNGNDLYNNLFTDLSPLIALFGEQVTKQFLSQAINWTDIFIVSILPLGILTIIVSGIRIGGSEFFKALIGRTREPRPDVQLELLSSTSPEVCEMWDGERIIRLKGQSQTQAFIVIQDPHGHRIEKLLEPDGRHGPGLTQNNLYPSLSLNVSGKDRTWRQTGILITFTAITQILILWYARYATRTLHLTNVGNSAAEYGEVCFDIGTVLMSIGLFVSAWVVKRASWVLKHSENYSEVAPLGINYQGLFLQPSCEVGDQSFPAIAILTEPGIPIITARPWSMKETKHSPQFILVGVGLAITGYLIQFIGIRALHWSVALLQLGGMGILTILRTWERRHISDDPFLCTELDDTVSEKGSLQTALVIEGLSTVSIALWIFDISTWPAHPYCGLAYAHYSSRRPWVNHKRSHNGFPKEVIDNVVALRPQLGLLLNDQLLSANTCDRLCTTIEAMIAKICDLQAGHYEEGFKLNPTSLQTGFTKFVWNCSVLYGHITDYGHSEHSFTLQTTGGERVWKMDRADMGEIFAMCCRSETSIYQMPPNFKRLVGHADMYSAQALNVWIDSNLKSFFYFPRLREPRLSGSPRGDSETPVLGLEMLPFIEQTLTDPTKLSPSTDAPSTDEWALQFNSLDAKKLLICDFEHDTQPVEASDLGSSTGRQDVIQSYHIISWLALEFFSIFFFELSGQIKSLGGTTTHTVSADGKSHLSNSTIDKIVSEIAKSEIWKEINEDMEYIKRQCRLIIIPSLATRGLLKDLGPQYVKDLWIPGTLEGLTIERWEDPIYY